MTESLATAACFSILFSIFYLSNVDCWNLKNEHATTIGLKSTITNTNIRFIKLTSKRLNSTTLFITWTSDEKEIFQNTTLQYRRSEEIDWQNLIINSSLTNINNSYFLVVANPCSNYEIRLKSGASIINQSEEKYFFSETITSFPPTISKTLDSTRPSLTKNIYDKQTDQIRIIFSIENHTLSSWPSDFRHVTTDVHVIECGSVFAAIPIVHWISNSKGELRFGDSFLTAIREGHSCKIMISILEPSKICDQSIKFEGELLDNALIVDMNCDQTENIHCESSSISKRKKIPPPRCDPLFVDASMIETNPKNEINELHLRWTFDKNSTTASMIAPEKILIRYGYTDVPSNADPLLLVLVPMREIDRFETDGLSKSLTLFTNKSAPKFENDQSNGQRFYRISICAVYGNESESGEERKINWAIVSTYAVKILSKDNENVQKQQCRCDESSSFESTTTQQIVKNSQNSDLSISHSSTPAPPPIVFSPSNQYENYWAKVAPLLAVFTVMTIVNLLLLMASYYYYKRAKSLNAMK